MNAPTWDLFISLFFIIGVAYGFILQREKVIVTLVAAYVALAATEVLMPLFQQFFVGDKTLFNSIYLKANASPFVIQTAIFGVLTVLLTVRSGLTGHKVRGFLIPLEVLAYSALNSAFIISTVLTFLEEDKKASLAISSKIAKLLIAYHDWWIVVPIILLIVTGFRHARRDEAVEY